MARIFNYIHLLIIVFGGLFMWGCNDNVVDPEKQDGTQYVRVCGYPKGFSEIDVSTRSVKNEFEVKLSTLYLLIFDSNGQIVGSPEFAPSGISPFLIDTHAPPFSTHNQGLLKQCDLFLVGNLNEGDLAGIRSLAELLNFEIEAKTIFPNTDPTFKGLVMIGKIQDKIDLSMTRPSNDNNIQEISMVNIYAKIVVNLQIQPEQHLPGNDQSFRMIGWEVVNAPRYATLGAPDFAAETTPAHNDKIAPIVSELYSGSNPVSVSQSLSYTFYILEHKRNKINTVTYPDGIDDVSKQRFKPKFINEDTDAAYMNISGIYIDHQGISHEIVYRLYLGANAVDDFYILRDNQYNNNITIKGVTSHNGFDMSVISFDARVMVNSGPVSVSVKRDTQLDCHFEVRPLDIYVSSGYTVDVAVDADAHGWIGLDRETVVDNKVVKRDYFTTDLISTLQKSYGPFTSDFRVWAYFDENISTSDRTGKIIFTYTENSTGNRTILTYTFLQKGLFKVVYNGNTYYIEFYEEYLHNFDSYDPFNNKTDGMFWGLDGIQLSYQRDAFRFNGAFSINITNGIKNLLGNYTYDFYTSLDIATVGDNGVSINTREGHTFTSEIVNKAGIGPLKLSEKPRSAVEYCYNKNKRNSAGIVPEIRWYLPAIDEIEDIVMGAYGTFSDFQNKYYWSSQPAYDYYTYHYTGLWGINSGDGNFFNDNLYNARATKVDYQNSQYRTVNSGVNDYSTKYYFVRSGVGVAWDNPKAVDNIIPPINDLGNQRRTNINRIRCVYKMN